MKKCRKEHSLHMLARCSNDDCREQIHIPHSCGHRSCPHCQNHENWQWIENQLNKQLPAQYYLLTFTLPQQLRSIAWRNQQLLYSLMFQCVQELLKDFTRNDKKLRGMAGFTTLLHTHSRRLDYHPHIHVVMTGASINLITREWRVKSSSYLFSHKALANVFRAKLLKSIIDNKLQIPKKCPQKWVVDCKHVGNGDKALIYLGKYRTRTVTGEYFLWLLMQHVLPTGFRKVRSYGFLHPCSKKLITLLQLLLRFNPVSMYQKQKQRAEIICKSCGAKMKIICTMLPSAGKLKPAHPI